MSDPTIDPTCAALTLETATDLLQCMADRLPAGHYNATLVGTGALMFMGIPLEAPPADLDMMFGTLRVFKNEADAAPDVLAFSARERAFLKSASMAAPRLFWKRYPQHRMPFSTINASFDGCSMMPHVFCFEQSLAFIGEHGGQLNIQIPSSDSLLATRLMHPRFSQSNPLARCKDATAVEGLLWRSGVNPDEPEAMLHHLLGVAVTHFDPNFMMSGPQRYTAHRMGITPHQLSYRPLGQLCEIGAPALVAEMRGKLHL